MAVIKDIQYEDVKNIETKFLNLERLEKFIGGFDKGGLDSIETDLSNGIKTEMKAGLSLESLNIGGRAPLNEIAQETLDRVKVSIQDVADIKLIARAEGNKHIKEEAQKLVEECEKEYKNRQKAFQEVLDSYNTKDNLRYVKDYNSEGKPIYGDHPKVSFEATVSGPISLSEGYTGSTDESKNVENALIDLNKFYYDYVEPAHEYNKGCSGLSTSTGGISKIGDKDKFKRPKGVQEGARVRYEGNSQGGKTIYTNPDGSTVEIAEDANGKRHVVKNRYNYVTEEIEYDKNGKEVKRTEYSWKKTAIAGVYVAGVTEYAYKDGKEQEGKKRMTSKFAYSTKNGLVKMVDDTQKIDMQEINISEAKKKAWTANYDEKFDSSTKINASGFTTVSSFEDAKEVMSSDEKKPFMIEEGTRIVEDRNSLTSSNTKFHAKSGPKYFTYDKEDKLYYEADANGNIIEKKPGKSIDPENFVKGTNKAWEGIAVDNNSRVEKTLTTEQEKTLTENVTNPSIPNTNDGLEQYLENQNKTDLEQYLDNQNKIGVIEQ